MPFEALLSEEKAGVLRFGGARMALVDVKAGFWGLRRQMEALVGRELTDNAIQQAGANGGASFAQALLAQANGETAVDAFRQCVAAYQAAGFGQFEIEVVSWPIGRILVRGQDAFEAWMLQEHGIGADGGACAYTSGVLVGFINALTNRRDIVCIEHSCQAQGAEGCLFELLPAANVERTAVVAFDPDPRRTRDMTQQTQRAEAHELATLLDISQHIASTLELEPLLDVILEQFKDLVAYEGASILALEGDTLQVIAYRGPIPQREALALRFPLAAARANKAVIENRETVIIGDVRADTPMARAFRRAAGERLGSIFDYVRSWMGVPLIARDEVIGMLSLDYGDPNAYTGRHGLLALTFANKVAVAMENARLYAHAEKDATVAERSRLARELHDAVSQTLFSASLIAEVLPQLWEHDIDEGRRRLEELRELTRGALAEMRALLMELRPATLTETSLVDLLRQLAEATRGRSRLPVTLDVAGEGSLPPDVQVAFYRIAQEALHNVTKHAAAAAVSMHLRQAQGYAELIIEDDGRGFDVKQSRPDSLGLGIMRERAAGMGATLNLESEIGAGTTVTVCWQGKETKDG